jgi:hypothetical protein
MEGILVAKLHDLGMFILTSAWEDVNFNAANSRERAEPGSRSQGRTLLYDRASSRGGHMDATERRISWGIFSSDSDEFLLQETGNSPFVQVTYSPPSITESDQHRVASLADHHQRVSILGHGGELAVTELGKLRSIIAERIVSHEDVARHAFEIFKSGSGASAFDNWLHAERHVLGI